MALSRPATPTVTPGLARRHRWAAATCAAIGLAALADVAAWNPDRVHLPFCPFRVVTGLDCPLCGGLRAAHDALHLHPGAAANHNLLLVCALPLFAAAWLGQRIVTRTSARHRTFGPWLIATALVVAGFWIARDLPIPALHWLRSGAA